MLESKKRKILFTNQQVTTDPDSQITRTVQKSGYITSEDDYVKFYGGYAEILYGLLGSEFTALLLMATNMNYDNQFIYNAGYFKILRERRGLSNAIRGLVKKNIVLRLCNGLYFVNPYLCAKGTFKNVLKMRDDFKVKLKRKEAKMADSNGDT